MAEEPPPQHPPPLATDTNDSLQYWCYQCDKRVPVETHPDLPDIICFECKNGFVETIAAAAPPPSRASSGNRVRNAVLDVLRVMALTGHVDDDDDDAPPPPPSEHADPSDDSDYLRIELDGWNNHNRNHNDEEDQDQDQDLDDDDDDDDLNEVEARNDEVEGEDQEQDRSGDVIGETEQDIRRRRRDVLRLRLRDFASRADSRRDRILDWAEILMGLEDHSIEFRLHVPDTDDYFGNPGDYVDAAGFEALLQNLAESDGSGRRGAPPAAKSAVEALQTAEIKSEVESPLCAICKDNVNVGEIATNLPCGHGYHGECIVPWLGSRNSCPVCRFELPTDDPEYEEDRKKRSAVTAGVDGCSSSSGSQN